MKKELITHRNPKSPIAEVFKTLRTNLQFMNSKKQLKTILITSTMPGEGKSWIAGNLAIAFAQTGKKVLLIDADMRKGRQHKLFNIDNDIGLSNYLSGMDETGKGIKADILKHIKTTEIEDLYIITSGNIPSNPSELLASEATIDMIDKIEELFDYVIFDGTPCLLVSDALIISRLVDTTIIVTEQNKTKKDNLEKVQKLIENVGGNIAGVVLNKVPVNAKKYMSSYYYSGGGNYSFPSIEKKSQGQKTNSKSDKKNDISNKKTQEIIDELNKYLNI